MYLAIPCNNCNVYNIPIRLSLPREWTVVFIDVSLCWNNNPSIASTSSEYIKSTSNYTSNSIVYY